MPFSRRIALSIAALAVAGLALGGCSSTNGNIAAAAGTADGTVTIEGPLIGQDATRLEQSWAAWEKTNHITIKYTGSANFDENIGGEAQQGNAPDLAIFEQPGLLNDLASRGYIRSLPSNVQSTVDTTFPAQWVGYTKVKGTDYGAPLLSTMNGWIFYSPAALAKLGRHVPTTWSQVLTLSGQLFGVSHQVPWCEGFDSDSSSGALGASFVSDMVLREYGTSVYDKWVTHKIKFNSPDILGAFNDAGEVLQNEDWVNAGFAGVSSINTTTAAGVANALQTGKCQLSYEPSSFLDDLPMTTNGTETVSPGGSIWAFLLPPIKAGSTPYTESGDFIAAFSNDSDTVKVQNYLASLSWANTRMKLGGAMSPALDISPSASPNSLINASVVLVQAAVDTPRLSAGDLMPAVVGDGTYLSGIVDWINGTQVGKVASTIDSSWPSQ
jgi:alpha-glucoside transport system substrate-binding protein